MVSLPGHGETISGFTVTELRFIHMLSAETAEFYHQASGARLLYTQNDDPELGLNLIYRTPQTDETDTNYILEHLLLSSCGKYPNRDILFDMDSKSYSTFMNGLTDNTYAYYPICTQSQEQLVKLMDVYLCCMEAPDALKEHNFYLREALRPELDQPDGPLAMQGTVLSEDWGYLTDIQENADSFTAKTLYPDLPASDLLGRLHFHYRELTYEHVQKAFEQYHDYSNCLMVLYGDMDYRPVLDFLHREHLDAQKHSSRKGLPLPQKEGHRSLSAMNQILELGHRCLVAKNPAYEDSLGEQASIIDHAISLTGSSQEELIYWDLFADILDSDTSSWHRLAREAGINNIMEVYLDLLLPSPPPRFRLRNGDEHQRDEFYHTTQSTLREVSSPGVTQGLYQAAMKENKLSDALTREGSHLGSNISEEIGRYWSQTGKTDYFQLYEVSARKFVSDSSQSILKSLATRAPTPKTAATMVTVPCPGMAEALEFDKEQYLKATLESMTCPECLCLCQCTAAFRQWNSKDWGNMNFLIRSMNLPAPMPDTPLLQKQFDPITSYTAPAFADAVGSYQIYFDLSLIPQNGLNYVSLYQMLLTELDTSRYIVEQQKTMEQEYPHDYIFDEVFPDSRAGACSYSTMIVFWYGLTEDFAKSLDFLLDLMGGGNYGDIPTIQRVLEKYLLGYDLSRTDLASSLFFSLAEGYMRQECRFRNPLNGQGVYYFLKDVSKRLKAEPKFASRVSGALRHISSTLLQGKRLVFMAAAAEDALEEVEREAIRQLGLLGQTESEGSCHRTPFHASPYILLPGKWKLAVCVDAPTQETRMMGDFRDNTALQGRHLSFLMACADKYLKLATRYQGGTYDSGIDLYIPAGYPTLWSTVGPDIRSTLDLFSNAGRALMDISLTQQDLDGYILSAYARALPPSGDLNNRVRYVYRAMAGIHMDQINLMIADIKNARLEYQAGASQITHALLEQGPAVTVGNHRTIRRDAGCFDEVITYHP